MNTTIYCERDATRTSWRMSSVQKGWERSETFGASRKTDLHGFLDPFTLLAIEGKLYLQYLKMIRIFLARYMRIQILSKPIEDYIRDRKETRQKGNYG